MAASEFNQVFDRSNTASVKWEMTKLVYGKDELLPMWVADMDFQPPTKVTEAIKNRMEHGIFGYTFIPPSTGEAIAKWLERRHQWKINPSWLQYSSGVVPSISIVIRALTEPGDKVMVQSPVYTPFFDMVKRNNREVVNSQLVLKDQSYEIDFADFEERLQEGVKLFLLCNPHNPGGRVWSEAELLKMGELCVKYNCVILADEIHSDLVFKPARHIPVASLSKELEQQVITLIAPTKTFNIAGLQASALVTPNPKWRNAIGEVMHSQGAFSLNVFGIVGMEAAYRYGEEWLEELLEYLAENIAIAKRFIAEKIPQISVVNPEGTYLLWIDCRGLGLSDQEIKDRLLNVGKLALEPGPKYGPGGEGFVRMNLACPQEILLEGLKRLQMSFE
ncbi:MalY/PatB family protein [Bacillus marasmi]|uniref:MalY/PatB family protein n=1 Tax=Bacillus marasmi TaxID=1926279 RepID=UPI0011C9600D|nr:PatB family C-S lyase [Bacillus marasmi]